MAKLNSTTIFGKLKATGDAILNGLLTVKGKIIADDTIEANNGIEVEGGTIDQYATVRAGPNADNGHLMLDANGGNVYTARDGGDTRINNGRLEDSLDANDQLIYNVNSLRDNAANCELVFDSGSNRFEFEDGSGNRTEGLFSRVYFDNNSQWFEGNHATLSGISSNDHHSKTDSASELTDVSADSVSDAHHSKYTDSEAQTAVNGANIDINGDADTVDGFEATDLSRPKNIAVLTSTDTSTDINTSSNVSIPFDKELQIDSGFSHSNSTNPEQLTFNDAGTYKIIASLSFSGSGSRNNPSVRLSLNGSILEPRGASGYMRNAEGHDEASSDVFEVLTVSSGDVLRVETIASADTGTVTLRANESRLIVEQVSETVARSEDADTVDGNHAADFASDNHNNSQHSTNFLPQTDYNPESDTHSKTSSASELSDVSADSNSDAHHSKYTDSEAVSAVNGSTLSNGLTVGDNILPDSSGSRNVGTSSTYFNEMHATAFTTHSPEPRTASQATESLEEYTDGYGSMTMGEKIADLITVVEEQRQRIEELEEEVNV